MYCLLFSYYKIKKRFYVVEKKQIILKPFGFITKSAAITLADKIRSSFAFCHD